MENKNIMTFCGSKPSQKRTLSLIKYLLILMEKSIEVLDELQDTQHIES